MECPILFLWGYSFDRGASGDGGSGACRDGVLACFALDGPDNVCIDRGNAGLDFAIAKTLAAVGIGMMGGFATATLMARGAFSSPLREDVVAAAAAVHR